MKELCTVEEAAKILKVSYRTVQRYLQNGNLNYTKPMGRVYILKEDIYKFALRTED